MIASTGTKKGATWRGRAPFQSLEKKKKRKKKTDHERNIYGR